MTEEQASKRACELLRKQYQLECSDEDIIEDFSTEWGWFMQGWKETINYKPGDILSEFREFSEELLKDKNKCGKFLKDCGIHDEEGNLTEEYGGEPKK